MATQAYPFEVRDSTITGSDNRKTGLTPTVSAGKTIAASPATVLASTVSVVEVTGGHYAALYDAEVNGDAAFPIDCGSSLSNPNDRYITLDLLRDSARLLAGFNGTGQLAPSAIDTIAIESGMNARQSLAVVTAMVAGSISGATTVGGTCTISGAGVSTGRVTMTGSAAGNRTGISLNLP